MDVLHTLTEYVGTDGSTADTDTLVVVLLLPLQAVLEVRVEGGIGSAVPSVVLEAAVLVDVLFGGRVDVFLHHGDVGGALHPILAQVDAGDLGRLDVALPVAVAASASAGIEVQPDRVDTAVVIDHGNVHHPIAVLIVQDRHRVVEVGPFEQQRELLVDFHGLLFAATGRAFRYNLRRRQQRHTLPVLQEDHLLARPARGMGRIREDRPVDAAGGAGSTAAAAAPMGQSQTKGQGTARVAFAADPRRGGRAVGRGPTLVGRGRADLHGTDLGPAAAAALGRRSPPAVEGRILDVLPEDRTGVVVVVHAGCRRVVRVGAVAHIRGGEGLGDDGRAYGGAQE